MNINLDMGISKTVLPAVRPWYLKETDLANSIIQYWKMDEESGNRNATIGSSTLVQNNNVGYANGITNVNSANFVVTSSHYFSVSDTPGLRMGNTNFWISMWFRPNAVNITSVLASKFQTAGNLREWQLGHINSTAFFQVSPDGTGTGNGIVYAGGNLIAGQWSHILAWHDADNDLIGVSIDGNGFSTAAYSGGVFGGAAQFAIGRQSGAAAYAGGRMESVALGQGYIPTNDDANYLYNVGVTSGVKSLTFFGYGGEPDWSADGSRIVFDRRDENDIYQIYTIKPSGYDEVCITDTLVSGGPAVDRHKGFPSWHPSGNYIVMQVEMASHIGEPDNKWLAEPGRGGWCNVWVTNPDGSQWWQLTNYNSNATTGCLNPRFSSDGTKLLWSRKINDTDGGTYPFARWDLSIADFAVVDGTPTLSNVTTFDPATSHFYEAHGFVDNDTKIMFTADPETGSLYGLDIYLYTLSDQTLVNLTNTNTHWDEHAHISKHSDEILAFMSTRNYANFDTGNALGTLRSELYLMDNTGANFRRLTGFNILNSANYNAEHSVCTVPSFNPTGNRLIFAKLLLGDNYDLSEGRQLWMITFNDSVVLP